MAGGWRHMTRDGGKPYDERFGEGSMLENGGDVVEALGQCYGMIWYLAARLVEETSSKPATRRMIQDRIEQARQNHKQGKEIGENFQVAPL